MTRSRTSDGYRRGTDVQPSRYEAGMSGGETHCCVRTPKVPEGSPGLIGSPSQERFERALSICFPPNRGCR